MIPYPRIEPEIFRVGPLAVRWYGMMYLLGFAASYLLVRRELSAKQVPVPEGFVDALYSWLIVGLLLGARLGYVVFYDLSSYLHTPLEVFALWHGGMSFHGGLVGSVIAGILFTRKTAVDFWMIADAVIITAPIGLGLGRLGNFMNGELFGRIADVPWAMVFPGGGPLPRHPSQLYEFLLEGVVLFIIIWNARRRVFRTGLLSALFLGLYGVFRIFCELFREPDPQLGFIFGIFTMGQLLSLCMIVTGATIYGLRRQSGEGARR